MTNTYLQTFPQLSDLLGFGILVFGWFFVTMLHQSGMSSEE